MKKNQKGFGMVLVLLLLFIVGVVGLVGWYVWYSKNNETASTNSGVQNLASQIDDKAAEFKVPEGWVEHKYTRTGISFWAPKDWKTVELEKINQISIDAPAAITAETVSGESDTFYFHINIASPSANSLDTDQKTPYIFSSSEIVTNNLLKNTYLTLQSPVESINPGVDSFLVTGSKYSTDDKSYKPAFQVDGTTYEIWGGVYYENDTYGPQLSLEQFNKLDEYRTAQDIIRSIAALK